MKFKKLKITLGLLLASCASMFAQDVALKTNLLYDALLSPSLGLEFGLAPKWSLDISGSINAWTINEKRWRHWMVQPELRYWFCQRFAGHFLAAHGIGGQYNVGNLHNNIHFLGSDFSVVSNGRRVQGWGAGAGIGYGYSWILGKHWNLEAEIGVGWIHTWYDIYPCTKCGKAIATDKEHDYFGPTKAAVNIIYVF